MEYRRLGNTGLHLSVLGYGSWSTFGNKSLESHAHERMAVAYDTGINYFDNAENYAYGQSEKVMGDALRKLRWPRDSYCLSSKVMFGSVRDPKPTQKGLSRKHIFDACHLTIKRLNTDYVDIYFCHRPDPNTTILETVRAMHDLVAQGKIMYWGTSMWSANEILEAHQVATENSLTAPSVEQPEYSLFVRNSVEKDLLPVYERIDIGLTTWSPLCYGILTGKYVSDIPDSSRASQDEFGWLRQHLASEIGKQRLAATRELISLAESIGMPITQLALAWCLINPRVTSAIMGASTPEQIVANVNAVDLRSKLNGEVASRVDELLGRYETE